MLAPRSIWATVGSSLVMVFPMAGGCGVITSGELAGRADLQMNDAGHVSRGERSEERQADLGYPPPR